MMEEWIRNELTGYKNTKEFPKYRFIKAGVFDITLSTHPLGMGHIASVKSKNIKDILEIPWVYGISEVVEKAKKDTVDLTWTAKDLGSIPVTIQGREFNGIIMDVTMKLIDYISNKKQILTQMPFEEPLMKIFNKFHLVAKKLEHRYNSRESLFINDEYDVQDLLHAILSLEFDSVQKEEYSPQFAGKRPRIDFFLRFEEIAIEVKKIRDHAYIKKIRDDIIQDKELYSKKHDINDLYFFIYDPDAYLLDRADFIQDLEKNKPKTFRKLKVIIKPDL